MKIGIVVACLVLTTYIITYAAIYQAFYDNVKVASGERPLSAREALFSDDFRNININAAVASVVGKYLLMNYPEELGMFDKYNLSEVVVGQTDFWRKGLNVSVQENLSVDVCNGSSSEERRRIYVIRHTEKLSKVIPDWVQLAFDQNGSYRRVDLNMPVVLPRRNRHPSDIQNDPPISMTGHIQAWLIGHCLRQSGVKVSHVYSSPTLRCIESANTMLLGLGVDVKIKIEPALLEWFKWSKTSAVMSLDELRRYHLNVDVSYEPFISYDKINTSEGRLDEYRRCYEFTKLIADRHKFQGGNILIVGHLSTMETVTRILSGGQPLPYKEFIEHTLEKPFGLISVLEEGCHGNWHKVLPPTTPITWHARLLWDVQKILDMLMK